MVNFDVISQIYGTIEASGDRSDYKKYGRHWLVFHSVQDLVVEGGGTLNGHGKIWWKHSCKIDKSLVSSQYVLFFLLKKKNLYCFNISLNNLISLQIILILFCVFHLFTALQGSTNGIFDIIQFIV